MKVKRTGKSYPTAGHQMLRSGSRW